MAFDDYNLEAKIKYFLSACFKNYNINIIFIFYILRNGEENIILYICKIVIDYTNNTVVLFIIISKLYIIY